MESFMNPRAVILAAGKGTRMGSLTHDVPKPMLEVRGKPILLHIIEGMKEAGVADFVLITGYKAEVIEEFFGDGSALGIHVQYARQAVQDGTGKAPELAKDALQGAPFLLTYGDILVKAGTYRKLVTGYQTGKWNALVTAKAGEEVQKGGVLLVDSSMRLTGLVEKPSTDQLNQLIESGQLKPDGPFYYNAGVYLFSNNIFDHTATLTKSPRGEFELTDAILGLVQSNHVVGVVEIDDEWVDVRDPDVLHSLHNP
jgi:UDP-N-acetylglucosamine diphosphorylase / glucose-1-phosphate thymidylyltransferase / UDP-N-acetylgalactosamine diphosphorylase / glucosamine-1-phosphate N-acetyltransferase / galactosamine-1-phosphate N-acetyltransferase